MRRPYRLHRMVPVSVELSREEWLAKRREYIGASDAAAILGADPRRGALAVFESKVTGYSSDDNKWMKYGRDIEGAIANMYSEETGREVIDLGATTITVHPDLPFLGATLDRQTHKEMDEGPHGPLELKSIDPYGAKVYPDQFAEEPPLHMLIQLMIQMACTGASWGSLAGLFPGYNLQWVDRERDDKFLSAALPKLEEFWSRVQRKDPPPPDHLPGTLDVVKRLYSQEDGTTIALDAEDLQLVDAWEMTKERARMAGKDVKEMETVLRAKLQDATFGVLTDGTLLSLKTTKRSGYTVKPTSFRTLRRARVKGK